MIHTAWALYYMNNTPAKCSQILSRYYPRNLKHLQRAGVACLLACLLASLLAYLLGCWAARVVARCQNARVLRRLGPI